MPFIGKQPQVGAYSKLDAITTSATATYNLTLNSGAYYPSSANHLMVSLNGVMQAPQDSFTISGATIIFASTLASTDSIDFIMALGDVLDIGTPSDGTVVTAKIQDAAVTTAKLASSLDLSGKTVTMPSGSVLQVVSTTASVQYANSSSTWNVKMTANDTTITPSSTSSKILVMVNVVSELQAANTVPAFDIYRSISGGATTYQLSGETYGFSKYTDSLASPLSYSYLDSPSTVSAITYSATAINSGGGTGNVYLGNNGIASTITLMEIAG